MRSAEAIPPRTRARPHTGQPRPRSKETAIPLAAPNRARQSFRHEALLWTDADEYCAVLVPFIEDGVAAGEPVMVATVAEHEGWLRDSLGPGADEVRFVDIARTASNPSRIMPVWQEFLDGAGPGRPVRGIGEPLWPGRRSEEIAEVQMLEALVNVAVDPETPFWLICPYDIGGLEREVVEEARRSHPALLGRDGYRGSGSYGGRAHIESMFEAGFEELTGPARAVAYDRATVGGLYAFVAAQAAAAGVATGPGAALAAACQRLAAGSLHRGATHGRLTVFDEADAVICELSDDAVVGDPLAGRRAPLTADVDGLWYVNQHSDLVRLRSNGAGTTVRVYAWK